MDQFDDSAHVWCEIKWLILLQGFVHVRIWFPQFPGVVMMSDQELIIMCKPPEPTIIENKAAGFAGSL
jgi:hypothetical protein